MTFIMWEYESESCLPKEFIWHLQAPDNLLSQAADKIFKTKSLEIDASGKYLSARGTLKVPKLSK